MPKALTGNTRELGRECFRSKSGGFLTQTRRQPDLWPVNSFSMLTLLLIALWFEACTPASWRISR